MLASYTLKIDFNVSNEVSAKTTMPNEKGLVTLLSIFLTEYDAAIQIIYQILATWQNALLCLVKKAK